MSRRRLALLALAVLVPACLAGQAALREKLRRGGDVVLVPVKLVGLESTPVGELWVLHHDVPQSLFQHARATGRRSGWMIVSVDERGRASPVRLLEPDAELGRRERRLPWALTADGRLRVGPGHLLVPVEARGAKAAWAELRVGRDGESILVGLRDADLNPIQWESPDDAP